MTVVTEHPDRQTPESTATAPPGPTLGRLVRGELLKVRTTNLWWILGICTLATTALALLVNGLVAHFEIADSRRMPDFAADYPPDQPPPPEEIAEQEAAWRAAHVLSDTLSVPLRTSVVVAKSVAAMIVAAVMWFVTTVIDLGVGTAIFAVEGQSNSLDVWAVQRAILMNLPAYALWALLGMGLGALFRNQIAATLVGAGRYLIGNHVIQFVFVLVYEFLINEAWVLQAKVLVPIVASAVMISPTRFEVWTTEDGMTFCAPPWWVGALVLVG